MELALTPSFYGDRSERSNIIVRPDSSDPASLAGHFEKPKPDMSAPARPTLIHDRQLLNRFKLPSKKINLRIRKNAPPRL
jgi:hypothetical protein